MKKILSLIVVLVMLVSLMAACGAKEEETTEEAPAKTSESTDSGTETDAEEAAEPAEDGGADTIKIGTLTPTSGELAVYGLAVLNAAQMAIQEVNEAGGINGTQVELIYYDNEGDPTKSINLFNKLVEEDGIDALVGPVISGTSLVVGELAEEAGIPMLTPTATHPDVTPGLDYVFRACYIDPYQGKIMAKFSGENLGASTAAIFKNVSSDYSVGLAKSFTEAFAGEVILDEGYTAEDNDFKAIIAKLSDKNPDVIFLPDYYDTVGLIAKQLNEAGVEATLVGVDGWDGILKDYKDEVEGGYFANHYSTTDTSEIVQGFISHYEELYGETPNALAALGYDAAKVMMAAIETAGTTDGEAVKEALAATSQEAVCGHISFDEDGNTIKDISIITIKDGKFELEAKVSEK